MDAASDRPAVVLMSQRARGSEQHTPVWVLAVLGVVGSAALLGACWVSGHVHADAALLTVARFLHIAALAVGMGAVLAVDWLAVLWMRGLRSLPEVLNTARGLQVPIWGGLAGLLVTGLFLRPNLESSLTVVKVGLVLAITLNGLYAHWLGQRLAPYKSGPVPRSLLVQSAAAAALSQTGWWGAALIGFLNSQS
ncbi:MULTISPECIES: hypothetical protein [Streptomyces]|uniref:Integral membrane protein n=1 Tax=Streptomyces solicathayae TaxID=3081768 RepID=A0ABZ0LYU3_9ACTN|nr:hypothetical protein [Streptomyces sp. HUAS YS2]WOX23968.1 hypothetical protein R2D22_22285 [Streptomyces sp. HUAS YS2]